MWRLFARIFSIVVLIMLVGLAAQILSTGEGVTQIDWNNARLVLPTWKLLVAVGGLIVLAVLFDRLVQFIASIPYRISNAIAAHRIHLGRRSLALGMAAAAAGDGAETMLHARKSVQYLGSDSMTDLLMAQASALRGEAESARRYFEALKTNVDTAYFGHVGLMRLAIAHGDEDAALLEGREAFRLKANSPSIAQAVFVLEAKSANWQAAAKALTVARRHTNKNSEFDLGRAAAVVAFESSKLQDSDKNKITHLTRAVRADGNFIPAALELADCYLADGQKRKAITLLEKTFARTPHPLIASRLMQEWGNAPASNLAQLIRLADKGGGKAEALFIVAEAAFQQSLWAEAERLAMRIPEDQRDSRVWRLLADLAHHEPEGKKQWPEREASLQQAAIAPRPPAWLCGNCASHYVKWQAVCDNCKVFGDIRWR